jgi:hypothetical protein
MARGDPLDGEVLMLAGAKASLSPARLPGLVDDAQAHLAPQLPRYRREYERIYESDRFDVFLVEREHWVRLGEALDLNDRECDALRRAHEEQLRWTGREADRLEEFESALEIREAVVIGR